MMRNICLSTFNPFRVEVDGSPSPPVLPEVIHIEALRAHKKRTYAAIDSHEVIHIEALRAHKKRTFVPIKATI
jgi:hypothetical protein